MSYRYNLENHNPVLIQIYSNMAVLQIYLQGISLKCYETAIFRKKSHQVIAINLLKAPPSVRLSSDGSCWIPASGPALNAADLQQLCLQLLSEQGDKSGFELRTTLLATVLHHSCLP